MFIIPYIRKTTLHNNMLINVFKILTIGGKNIWEESNGLDIDTDILEPNGIFRTGSIATISKLPTYYLCEIDSNKTALTEFYKWEELPISDEETFCWKTYTYLTDTNENIWLPIPETETLNGYKVSMIINAILS